MNKFVQQCLRELHAKLIKLSERNNTFCHSRPNHYILYKDANLALNLPSIAASVCTEQGVNWK